MANLYSASYTGSHLDLKQALVGICAVVRTWPNNFDDSEEREWRESDIELKPILKRTKIHAVVDDE